LIRNNRVKKRNLPSGERWSTALVDLKQMGEGKWMMRQIYRIKPFKSDDPDSQRIFW